MEPSANVTRFSGFLTVYSNPVQGCYEPKLQSSKSCIYASISKYVACQPIILTDITWLFSHIAWLLTNKPKLLADVSKLFPYLSKLFSYITKLFSNLTLLQSYLPIILSNLSIL